MFPKHCQRNCLRQSTDPEKIYSSKGCWQKIARSAYFKGLTLFMVLMSTAWIAVDTDYNNSDCEHRYIFVTVDNIICVYFCIEITVRWLACHVCSQALQDWSFLFDLFLAVTMSIETWGPQIVYWVTGRSTQSGLGMGSALRSLRLIRITRAFRMSRLFRSVPELMILVHGMFQGVRSVCTTLILLLLVTYTFAVAMTQLLQNKDVGKGKFDDVATATNFLLMQTLCGFNAGFMTTMLNTDVVSFIILLTYQLLGLALWVNMLTGVMVDVVGTTAQLEQEEQSLKTLKRDIADVVNLTDENHDRTVTAVEFTHMIQNPVAVKKLYEGGVNVLALVDYADFVFRDTSELSLEEFIETVLQFRGQSPATVKDVVDLRVFVSKELARLEKDVATVKH
ncbi:Sodium channel protein type 10 subunit alpha (Peripheral nerve sodium channel 3) (PN3) (Sensory neuron sodium channel) (Sodium channel protein type X subunit alpha) (Voltage-gated sodium channel subunit alpha Nav1.8) [Durusdinium trenchii]|uniref:Ion transport domain-containing protein n=1 Tax=Durusdinium trenchii TaxID=1381693 RepID=A0ABP0QEX8_9DINO